MGVSVEVRAGVCEVWVEMMCRGLSLWRVGSGQDSGWICHLTLQTNELGKTFTSY